MKTTKVLWQEVNGSIYTVPTQEMRSDFPANRTIYQVPVAIAFNVGRDLARHIVELHNKSLPETS